MDNGYSDILSVFGQKPRSFPHKIVYHYCSVQTFEKIIRNSTIRATNIRKSNDYTEIINTLEVFMDAIPVALEKYWNDHPEDEVFDEFLQNLDVETLVKGTIDNPSCIYYCACFSEARDLLSQWRGYADNGRGVAIGFKDVYFMKSSDPRHFSYKPIVYDLFRQKRQLIEYLYEIIADVRKHKGTAVTCADYENTFNGILSTMVYNTVFCKNGAFAEERERRLVYYPFHNVMNLMSRNKSSHIGAYQMYYDRMGESGQYTSEFNGIQKGQIEFMTKDNEIVSYVDLNFKNILPYCIKEIVLGPKNQMDDMDLRLFLHMNGIDMASTKITRSESTYR